MSTFREADNETMAGVNSRFAEVPVKNILQIRDNAILHHTKKATNVFRGKQCFNTLLTCTVSSALTAFLNPDRQVSLMPLSSNNICPSTTPFQSPIRASSIYIEQNVSIQESLNVIISKNGWDFQQQAHDMISGGSFTNCSFNFSFK